MVTSLRPGLNLQRPEDRPDYDRLIRLFSIPTLRHVHIDCAYRWDCGVPSEFQQRGFSEVRSLTLTHSDPPGEDLGHVLSWMKDPQSLHIEVSTDYDRFYPFAPILHGST